MGADRKANTLGWGALQIGDLRLLENSSESGGALGSNVVAMETASEGWIRAAREQACQWALTGKQTLGSWFERQAAYSSVCSIELPLRPTARAAPPSGPRSFNRRLQAPKQRRVSMGADMNERVNTVGRRTPGWLS